MKLLARKQKKIIYFSKCIHFYGIPLFSADFVQFFLCFLSKSPTEYFPFLNSSNQIKSKNDHMKSDYIFFIPLRPFFHRKNQKKSVLKTEILIIFFPIFHKTKWESPRIRVVISDLFWVNSLDKKLKIKIRHSVDSFQPLRFNITIQPWPNFNFYN